MIERLTEGREDRNIKILMIGLDNAGKNTILKALSKDYDHVFHPNV